MTQSTSDAFQNQGQNDNRGQNDNPKQDQMHENGRDALSARTAKNDIVIKGFLEFYVDNGGSFFGINQDRVSPIFPQPLLHGDYIAMYHDDERNQNFLQGYLLVDHDRLLTDPTYTDTEKHRFADKPFYFIVMNQDDDAVNDYLTAHPRSPLRYELQAETKMLSPQTVCELFATEKAAILIRSQRAEQKRLAEIERNQKRFQSPSNDLTP